MSVTELSHADRSALFTEVERLTQSSVLHGSEALCRLLRYLAEQYVSHPGVPIKEYQLAVDVFGRPEDFDPRMDSTVRVQTGRLRSKISEYYASVGADDPIVLEIPKGSYSLGFHHRAVTKSEPVEPSAPNPPAAPATVSKPNGNRAAMWVLAALCFLLSGLLAWTWLHARQSPPAEVVKRPSELIKRFWAPFVRTNEKPWIIFSNAEFIGRPQDGMRYFDPSRDSRAAILDHYTGVGEVLAVADLVRVFEDLHHEVRVKRGRLLSLDDVKNNDVIFLGSSAENLTLREIPTTQSFLFKRVEAGPRAGDTEVVNVNPKPGEPKTFLASGTLPITEDYGVIALVPGINPARWVLVLAGTTTMGTQEAAEYVSRESTLKKLLDRMPGKGVEMNPFEVVIRVRISGGVPVSSTIVAFRSPA